MKPYKNISTHHLGLLLFAARAFAISGILALFIGLAFAVSSLFSSFASVWGSTYSVLISICISLGFLFISGIAAAIVAFEESYRIRTENMTQKDNTSK
ncbi:hypothetical protein QP938_01875 [Porticoccaceae bacterium LTM1]|nr:hypothetical protein QP938_01875 [Porticoccaceae bacterium LTM1]